MSSWLPNKDAEVYRDIFLQLKSELRWRVSDSRSLMMISAMYVVNSKSLNVKKLISLSSVIKDSVGAFSALKSFVRYNLAAMLLVRYENPEEKFAELLRIYNRMVEKGFSRGTFTYLSAFCVLSRTDASIIEEDLIEKALSLYKAMKKEHYFLTSVSDYPLAILLAQNEGPIEDLIGRMEYFYRQLSAGPFAKSDQLQFLSHILTLEQNTENKVLADRCMEIYQAFKDNGIKPKNSTYPAIGLLSLLDNPNEEIISIVELTNSLNSEKVFKWYKTENFMMAVHLIMSNKIQNAEIIDTGIFTAIETIIQAQQAAMTAAMVSVSAAAASGGGE
ncbi:hypothetical protein JOC77_000764 [Peribacillus deserti]|uniref:DUF4003 domain-containing protein n=1 Tax=Peribacillus deserti TaxID=673318 RepID=A0ABS2QDZ4_9BACI|nr:DUF4003 family protein [Peribacillus deserti]MBM7691359.1 hypothetical protein [Peribacillus deserti]